MGCNLFNDVHGTSTAASLDNSVRSPKYIPLGKEDLHDLRLEMEDGLVMGVLLVIVVVVDVDIDCDLIDSFFSLKKAIITLYRKFLGRLNLM